MFSKLFKKSKSSSLYVSLVLHNCTLCENEEHTLKTCHNCDKKSICISCHKQEKYLCHSCDKEYTQWQKQLEKVAKKEQYKNDKKQENPFEEAVSYDNLLEMDEDFLIY